MAEQIFEIKTIRTGALELDLAPSVLNYVCDHE